MLFRSNWWSWYCRAAHPTGRLEAITSRPLLLAAVGKAASHANQTTLYLTPLHGRADVLKRLIANIGAALQHVRAAAEQFKDLDRWGCLLRYISDRIAQPRPPPGLPATSTAMERRFGNSPSCRRTKIVGRLSPTAIGRPRTTGTTSPMSLVPGVGIKWPEATWSPQRVKSRGMPSTLTAIRARVGMTASSRVSPWTLR